MYCESWDAAVFPEPHGERRAVAGGVKLACAAGIDGLELYSYYDVPALTYRKLMNEAGVVCCGTHNHWAPLRDDLDHVMEYNYVLGNRTIICHT